MRNKDSFVGFDFDRVWAIDSGINSGYPYLRGFGEYRVSDDEEKFGEHRVGGEEEDPEEERRPRRFRRVADEVETSPDLIVPPENENDNAAQSPVEIANDTIAEEDSGSRRGLTPWQVVGIIFGGLGVAGAAFLVYSKLSAWRLTRK